MKRILLIALLVTSISLISTAQYVRHTQNYYTFDSAWAENVCLVRSLYGQGYVIAPTGIKFQSTYYMGLMGVDNNFNISWKSFYTNNPYYYHNYFTKDLAADTINLGYVLCGTFDCWGPPSYISVFDANGYLQWMKKYPYVSKINAIIPISFSGNLHYVACGQNSQAKAIIFGLDSLGNTLWAKKVTNFDNSEYTDVIKVGDNGDIIATGHQGHDNEASSFVTRITTTGNIIYSWEFYGNEQGLKLNAVCFNNDTNYYNPTLYLTGSFGAFNSSDVVMMKVAYNDGTLFMANFYDINQNSTLEHGADIMKLRNNNEIAITGESYFTEFGLSDTNGFILRLDTNGNYISSTLFGESYENRLSKIVRNNANDAYVMGGNFLRYLDKKPYIVEAYNNIQEECYSHENVVEPNILPLDTFSVFHVPDTINSNAYYVYSLNNNPKNTIICKKEKSKQKRMRQFQENKGTQESLLISPSMTSDYVYVSNINSSLEYHIISVSGRLIQSGKIESESSLKLDFSDLAKGIYILRVYYKNEYITKKIIRI